MVDGTKVSLEPGKNDVTEMDIKMLHSMDDSEVYYSNKRPEPTAKVKQEIKELEERTNEEWAEKNYSLSLDSLASADGCNDKSKLWHQAYNRQQEIDELNPRIERLHEVVMLLTPDQQELYRIKASVSALIYFSTVMEVVFRPNEVRLSEIFLEDTIFPILSNRNLITLFNKGIS